MKTGSLISIPESIQENIFRYRLSHFLKEQGKAHSGNQSALVERIESNSGDDNFRNKFMEFVIEEISNGKNRQIYLSRFEIANLAVLRHLISVQSNLEAAGYPNKNFNSFLKPEPEDGEMIYLNIVNENEDTDIAKIKVRKIEMCFYKIIKSMEDEVTEEISKDYVWVEINPSEQLLIFKIRPHNQHYRTNYYTSKKTYESVFLILKSIFPLKIINMEYIKGVFFKIFSELTEIAEQPYREQLTPYNEMINEFQNSVLEQIGITNADDVKEITIRYKRLIERHLIIRDLDNYLAFHTNRKGIVERISLTDLSGASANVLSGDGDGLDVADIYFDIRETIEGMKRLDKLWVKWFLFDHEVQEMQEMQTQIQFFEEGENQLVEEDASVEDTRAVKTRFEVTKDYVIINFLKQYWISKEVQDHVLSTFIEFEEKTNQQS
ncbi:hypothetical protein CYL18_04240 [Pradoshia eiseniae]|uniref:Uncharacterized protein n=1 Tax=Pradoshia eiseniae TaxID=2064768 RepID=A0A2S7N4T3_9BACI|nr:hypothetical protein [Pradoshia eiseniae]PQD97091.1 hypothetical protein CYL18_04240 [Pradoshia eiseniae]